MILRDDDDNACDNHDVCYDDAFDAYDDDNSDNDDDDSASRW